MKRYLPFIIIVLVGLTSATAGSWLYRAKHARMAALAARTAADNIGGKPGATPAHVHGPDNVPVTIEEFGDFQCPPCAGLATVLRNLERDYAGKLRVIFRQYPLDMHKHARLAAFGAEAAALQGRFWQMHEQLYITQNEWSKAEDFKPLLNTYATKIGLDAARFARDLQSEKSQARLKLDRERADSLGVNSTPTLFVNGKLVAPAARTPEALKTAIQEALDGQKNP